MKIEVNKNELERALIALGKLKPDVSDSGT